MPDYVMRADALDLLSEIQPVRETTEGVAAWRAWRLVLGYDRAPRLVSLSRPDSWDGPATTCDLRPDTRGRGRQSGLHAWRTPGGLASSLGYSAAIVYGEVTLHGRVCVHQHGYRAEHARIDRLYLRACGLHRAPAMPRLSGDFFMMVAQMQDYPRFAGAYCACRALAAEDWLPDGELERLATGLESRYRRDVIVDTQRARTPGHACTATRLLTSANREHR